MIIKQIPDIFKANGYYYKLIRRVDEYVLYEQKSRLTCNAISYEVHQIRIRPISEFHSKIDRDINRYTHYEKLAGNSEFGKFAWSFATLEGVKMVWPIFFNEMVVAK